MLKLFDVIIPTRQLHGDRDDGNLANSAGVPCERTPSLQSSRGVETNDMGLPRGRKKSHAEMKTHFAIMPLLYPAASRDVSCNNGNSRSYLPVRRISCENCHVKSFQHLKAESLEKLIFINVSAGMEWGLKKIGRDGWKLA